MCLSCCVDDALKAGVEPLIKRSKKERARETLALLGAAWHHRLWSSPQAAGGAL